MYLVFHLHGVRTPPTSIYQLERRARDRSAIAANTTVERVSTPPVDMHRRRKLHGLFARSGNAFQPYMPCTGRDKTTRLWFRLVRGITDTPGYP